MNRRVTLGIFLAAIACMLLPKPPERVAPPEPVVAIVLRGPSLEQLEAARVLDRMRASTQPWAASDLSIIPGAAGDLLWRRIETGMIRPVETSPNFASMNVPVVGSWSADADASVDRSHMDELAARPDRWVDAPVIVLSCAAAVGALEKDDCRAVIDEAIELAEKIGAGGGTGVVLSVPPSGAPARGAVWVASRHLKSAPRFRFREIDLLPLLLYLRGNSLPVSLEGVPGIDLLSGEFMFHRPVRFAGGSS